MMIAVGYARVSTASQSEEGISLEAQQHRIQCWCQANGYQLQQVFVEARSAARADNRPQLQVALSKACQAKAVLVVFSLSRLARSTKDALLISERLDKAGADLVSLSERIDSTSPMGKMVFRLLAAISEFEKDQLVERTRLAMAHLRQLNKRISNLIPLGYDLAPDGQTLIENPAEQKTVKEIMALRQQGLSLVQIARQMEREGVRTKNGAGWYPSTVARILARQRKLHE
jgi:site-specific DNA recombinase